MEFILDMFETRNKMELFFQSDSFSNSPVDFQSCSVMYKVEPWLTINNYNIQQIKSTFCLLIRISFDYYHIWVRTLKIEHVWLNIWCMENYKTSISNEITTHLTNLF